MLKIKSQKIVSLVLVEHRRSSKDFTNFTSYGQSKPIWFQIMIMLCFGRKGRSKEKNHQGMKLFGLHTFFFLFFKYERQ